MPQTVGKAEQALPATSPAGRNDGRADQHGFTLLEVVCVLLLISFVVGIALPHFPTSTSRMRLEGYAYEVAALIRSDQNAARLRRADLLTIIDLSTRTIRSGARGQLVRLPEDVAVEAVLADRCNGRSLSGAILHLASGMSCGGVLTLSRLDWAVQVRVNWLTGGIEVDALR